MPPSCPSDIQYTLEDRKNATDRTPSLVTSSVRQEGGVFVSPKSTSTRATGRRYISGGRYDWRMREWDVEIGETKVSRVRGSAES